MSKKPTYVIEAYRTDLLRDIDGIDDKINSFGLKKKDYYVILNPRNTHSIPMIEEDVYTISVYIIKESLEAAEPIADELERILHKLGYETFRRKSCLLWDENIVAIDITGEEEYEF